MTLAEQLRLGLLLVLFSVASFAEAAADPASVALVISVDHATGLAAAGACGPAAQAMGEQLTRQGFAVQALLNPSSVALRSAIDGFAAQVEDVPRDRAVMYVCGSAIVVGDRVFLMPADAGSDGPVDADRQGVVLQALLNALNGSKGTLYADLVLANAASTDAAANTLAKRLPAGLHLALSFSGPDGVAPIGRAMAASGIDAGQGWKAIPAALQSGLPPDARTLLLPPPASAATAPPLASEASLPSPRGPASPGPPGLPAASPPEQAASTPPAPPVPPEAPPAAPASAAAEPPPTRANLPAPARAKLPPLPEPRRRPVSVSRRPNESSGEGDLPGADRIRRLQMALARVGYTGPIDGHVNDGTLAAIRAYQHTLGDPQTGVMTQPELVRLLNH